MYVYVLMDGNGYIYAWAIDINILQGNCVNKFDCTGVHIQ